MTTLFKWIYELSYRFTQPNWDSNTVPDEVVTFSQRGNRYGRALDLGCGTGTHSIYLARQGYTVVGVDFSSKAIQFAHQKANPAREKVDFRVGDVTRLDFLQEPFDISLDVGCFHGLNKSERTLYTENLSRLMRPGGLFLLWAVESQSRMGIGLSSEEIEQTFMPFFTLDQVKRDNLHGRASAWYWFTRR